MEPVFDMPELPEAQPPADLDAVRQSLRMLRELHDATVQAFREELRDAVRRCFAAEAKADVEREKHKRAWTRREAEHQADVNRWYERFAALFNAASTLFQCLHSIPPGAIPAEQQQQVSDVLRMQDELLRTAGEYLI